MSVNAGGGCSRARSAGRLKLLGLFGAGAVIVAALALPTAPAGAAVTCATTISATTQPDGTPGPGATPNALPCWTDVQPYPFGSNGSEVTTADLQSARCSSDPLSCYLTVTSLAFRSWNRGLAATTPARNAGGSNAYGVWKFNGTDWRPDPTFPGSDVCKGGEVVFAGKLDYWLIRPVTFGSWAPLCRLDGTSFTWEPLSLPQATLDRVTFTNSAGQTARHPGDITSAACFSWDNCWFSGTYGTTLHWDGNVLSDASPSLDQAWLATGFEAAIARIDQNGNPFGAAVGATSTGSPDQPGPLPAQPDGTQPAEMFGSSGGSWLQLPFTPPTSPQPGDPYRTDLVGVDFDPTGSGWVAGNPAGFRARGFTGVEPDQAPNGRPAPTSPEPAPLVPLFSTGGPSACVGPPASRFTYTYSAANTAPAGAFLWSAISAVPLAGDAWASGRMRPATTGATPHDDGLAEPVVVHVGCGGSSSVTRFRIPDPTYTGNGAAPRVPADRGGTATAIAANAANDAWLATSRGTLGGITSTGVFEDTPPQVPHIYRFTDGNQPAAAPGDDNEYRPPALQLDPPVFVTEPSTQTVTIPAPTTVSKLTTVSLPPAVYHVKFRVRGGPHPHLYLTFKLRRPVTLGAQALLHGRVVSTSPMRHFTGRTGELVLALDRKRWPNGVRFVTDAPTTTLRDPGKRLRGAVKLVAEVTPYRHRAITSVRFEYAPAGTQTWTAIATVTTSPWTTMFDTTQVPAGLYDLRAVATDVAAKVGASPEVTKRRIGG